MQFSGNNATHHFTLKHSQHVLGHYSLDRCHLYKKAPFELCSSRGEGSLGRQIQKDTKKVAVAFTENSSVTKTACSIFIPLVDRILRDEIGLPFSPFRACRTC